VPRWQRPGPRRWALTMPSDERALILACYVHERLSITDPVGDLARQHGMARRTLERRLREETGMSSGM
jgi:transcriptional regulator GlxA family with amidase domain